MILPLVDPFTQPYESWTKRRLDPEEMMANYQQTGVMSLDVNDQLFARVSNPLEAAHLIAKVSADGGLDRFLNDALDKDPLMKVWGKVMPSATPRALLDYKNSYPHYDLAAVNDAIASVGAYLSPGQVLFHAGLWPGGQSLVTDRPLSTTFCPQVALSNAAHGGKAFDAGRIDLFVVRVVSSMTPVYAFKRKGMNLGHENEVLFTMGATLTLRSHTCVRTDYPVGKGLCDPVGAPLHVLEIDLS